MPEKSAGSSRWWEYYAVRYAMGTVVGAVVLYILCLKSPALKPFLFDTTVTGKSGSNLAALNLDPTRLTLLAAFGMVYCYIASGPILVFHATRFLFDFSATKKMWLKRVSFYFLPPVSVPVAIFWWAHIPTPSVRWFVSMAAYLTALVIWLEYLAALFAFKRRSEIYPFYKQLSDRRDQTSGGIIESYRHLREHGNSFFIVLLEIVLGVVAVGIAKVGPSDNPIASRQSLSYLVALLIVWILPAVFVWVIATIFEREFSDSA